MQITKNSIYFFCSHPFRGAEERTGRGESGENLTGKLRIIIIFLFEINRKDNSICVEFVLANATSSYVRIDFPLASAFHFIASAVPARGRESGQINGDHRAKGSKAHSSGGTCSVSPAKSRTKAAE